MRLADSDRIALLAVFFAITAAVIPIIAPVLLAILAVLPILASIAPVTLASLNGLAYIGVTQSSAGRAKLSLGCWRTGTRCAAGTGRRLGAKCSDWAAADGQISEIQWRI